MEINRMIELFNLELTERDGKDAIAVTGCIKPNQEQVNEIREKKEEIIAELKRRTTEKEEIINDLITGKRNIEWGIVGCDYPMYQAWVRNIPEYINVQDVMETAIKEILTRAKLDFIDTLIGNPCDFLSKVLRVSISTEDELPKIAHNFKHNEKMIDYYGFKKEIVTHFDTNLYETLKPYIEKKIGAERAKKHEIERLTELAKLTGEKQLLERWPEDCNDPEEECNVDIVSKYIMPDGTIKIERHHTW